MTPRAQRLAAKVINADNTDKLLGLYEDLQVAAQETVDAARSIRSEGAFSSIPVELTAHIDQLGFVLRELNLIRG